VANGGNVVELVVSGAGVCVGGGSRLWFPNAGGWFAFYDNNGVPQDAVSWANQSNLDEYPCIPTSSGCSFSGSLANYNEFPNDRKEYILNQSAANFQGQSLRRIPDGGAWSTPGTPTYGSCNAACVNPQLINCNGSATASPVGGTPPYSFLWDDPRSQTTQTADQLCAGTYCVTITDALSNTFQECITVVDGVFEENTSDGFCNGDSYTLPDNSTVGLPGQYTTTFQTGAGCDSLITVDLEVYPTYNFSLNPSICDNQSYTLPDGSVVEDAGTYPVAFTTMQGCDSLYTVELEVLPPVDISLSAEICPGDSYTLPDGSEVSTQGTYPVLISGGSDACDTLYTVELEHYDTFTPTIGLLNDISCFGENDGSAILSINNGSAPYSFNWSDGENHGLEPSGLIEGTYTLNVEDVNGCETSVSFDISEPDPLSISASADTLICIGTSTDLSAQATGGTGAITYHWSHTASANSVETVSPDEDTQYSVYASDENGCLSDTITLNVAVISLDSALLEIVTSNPICAGGESTVEASYDGLYPPYTFTWDGGLPDGPGPHEVVLDETTTYQVSVSDQCGNVLTQEATLTIWPLPVAEVITTDLSCFAAIDGTASISVSEGSPDFSFDWSDGGDHGANPTNLAGGEYDVNISDANGCETEISFVIGEPMPVSITATADTLICIGTSTDLSAEATGGTGAFTYHWSHTASANAVETVSPEVDSNYGVYATDENGCTTDTIGLSVAVISLDSALLEIFGAAPICEGESATLSANYDGAYPPYDFSWSPGELTGTGPYVVSPTETTTYNLTLTDICDNSLDREITIEVNPLPEIHLPDELLNGCSPLTAQLYDSLNTSADFTHEWVVSNGTSLFGNPVELELTESGLYEIQLVITSPAGCSDSSASTLPVEVFERPYANFSASTWTTDMDGPEISFFNTSDGFTSSVWQIDGNTFADEASVSYSFPDTGQYAIQLFVENEFGCADSITRFVTIAVVHTVTVPNAFTPTSDGDNPLYDPTSTSNTVFYPFSEYVDEYRMSIFNRWGELIFESDETQLGWNGTYRGKPCPQDVYVYRIDMVFTDGFETTKVGDITLFR
jgi:gliding motility-associated-like protein